MLDGLQADALRVIIELADRGEPPTAKEVAVELDVTTEEVAAELDVSIATVTETIDDLWRAGHVSKQGRGWSADTWIDPPPDDEFVGFFEDARLVEEFHQIEQRSTI